MIGRILKAGPAAVIASGGGILFAQHELHYLLRPSMVETLAGIAGIGAAALYARSKGRKSQEQAEQDAPMVQAHIVDESPASRQPRMLPRPQGRQSYAQFVNVEELKRVN